MGGRISLVASPRLSDEDIEAIRGGYKKRSEVIEKCLLNELDDAMGPFEEARLNLLSNLIAYGVLRLKIASFDSPERDGLFHEKLGIVHDADGDSVAFTGSMNETASAFFENYESIDVYTSWSQDADRVADKQSAFSSIWNNLEPGLEVVEFPDLNRAIIEKYKIRDGVNLKDFDIPFSSGGIFDYSDSAALSEVRLRIPSSISLRDYQVDAIDKWQANGYCGVFDMATGTGKTITALSAATRLFESLSGNLAIVIIAPYQHLVEQWKDVVSLFGIKPVVCYSTSSQTNWRSRVKTLVNGFRFDSIDCFCIVATNSTFSSAFMQEQISKLRGNCLIVVDEAHNFGTSRLSSLLPEKFPYRIALSATIDRYGDPMGTLRVFRYFGDKCIEYSLEDAINNGMLTPYRYYPIVVSLSPDELEDYLVLTKKIGRLIASGNERMGEMPESAKQLLIRRARIVAGAAGKMSALKKHIAPFRKASHLLVYCGATTINDCDYGKDDPGYSDVRQIEAVSRMLGNELGMRVARFTSEEDATKREALKRAFSDGSQLQALVAIRCLDEGVDIPNIETAFILASSTNPKEYIQRRGRVLRLSEGKRQALIYDFVTLPISLEAASGASPEIIASSKGLAVREIIRMRDFARISENPTDAIGLIGEIVEAYGITAADEEERLYE